MPELGKARKNNAENIPPPSFPFADGDLPTPPVSPSKRKSNSESNEYSSSPSKKRGGVLRPIIPDNERGRLFKKTVSVSELVFNMDKSILRSSSDGEPNDVFL